MTSLKVANGHAAHLLYAFASLRDIFLLLCSLITPAVDLGCARPVRIGAEVLIEKRLDLLSRKRVGIICNHTSLLPNGTHLVDTLLSLGVRVTALFAPEHGIRGSAGAGKGVASGVDKGTGLPEYSLYGKVTKPTAEMLKDVDVLIFDIQDIGARFYTYASTMAHSMQAAAEHGKRFILLDRPNPIDGIDMEGPVLDTALASFVGLFPIPIRHGLTLGELAGMIVGERWLGEHDNPGLTIIPIEGWKRGMWFDQTGLPWTPPSPNMRTLSTAAVYPGTCLFEATNVSEGRGTDRPFEYVGAPWIDGAKLSSQLEILNLSGVAFAPIQFTPKADSIAAPNPKFQDQLCGGVFVNVTERNLFRPVETALMMLEAVMRLYPDSLRLRDEATDRLTGSAAIRRSLIAHQSVRGILENMRSQLERFQGLRSKYLLYN